MLSTDRLEEKKYQNKNRERFLHAWRRIAFVEKQIQELRCKIIDLEGYKRTIEDDIIDWTLGDKRNGD